MMLFARKKLFRDDRLLQLMLILSLLRGTPDELFNFTNPELDEINLHDLGLGSSLGHTQIPQIPNINIHPKSMDRVLADYQATIIDDLNSLGRFSFRNSNQHRDVTAYLLGSHQNQRSSSTNQRSSSSSGSRRGVVSTASSSSEGSQLRISNPEPPASVLTPLSPRSPAMYTGGAGVVQDPSTEDEALIDALFKQDVDMGVPREAFYDDEDDTNMATSVYKDSLLELEKPVGTRDRDFDNQPSKTKTVEEKGGDPEWTFVNITIDSETGEHLIATEVDPPPTAATASPTRTSNLEVPPTPTVDPQPKLLEPQNKTNQETNETNTEQFWGSSHDAVFEDFDQNFLALTNANQEFSEDLLDDQESLIQEFGISTVTADRSFVPETTALPEVTEVPEVTTFREPDLSGLIADGHPNSILSPPYSPIVAPAANFDTLNVDLNFNIEDAFELALLADEQETDVENSKLFEDKPDDQRRPGSSSDIDFSEYSPSDEHNLKFNDDHFILPGDPSLPIHDISFNEDLVSADHNIGANQIDIQDSSFDEEGPTRGLDLGSAILAIQDELESVRDLTLSSTDHLVDEATPGVSDDTQSDSGISSASTLDALTDTLDEMIQASQFHPHHPRAYQGRLGGLVRSGSMEQRWQDLASFLSLPPTEAPHHQGSPLSHHPTSPHAPHPASPTHAPQIHHPHALYPTHDGGVPPSASPGMPRGVLLHNATLPPPMSDAMVHNLTYSNSMGASSHLVSSSMNLTNSSELAGAEHSQYKMETSSSIPSDMMYYQNSTSEINQTDGFLSTLLNDDDLQIMDLAMSTDSGKDITLNMDTSGLEARSPLTGDIAPPILSEDLFTQGEINPQFDDSDLYETVIPSLNDECDVEEENFTQLLGLLQSIDENNQDSAFQEDDLQNCFDFESQNTELDENAHTRFNDLTDADASNKLKSDKNLDDAANERKKEKHKKKSKKHRSRKEKKRLRKISEQKRIKVENENTVGGDDTVTFSFDNNRHPVSDYSTPYRYNNEDPHSRLPQVAQKKQYMFGRRGFHDPHGSSSVAGGLTSVPVVTNYSGHYPPTPTPTPGVGSLEGATALDPCDLKYSSMEYRSPDVGGAVDHVHHNHTYHMSPEGPSGLSRPLHRDKHRGKRTEAERSLTRDEKRARALNLPITCEDIINLPMDEFNERISKYDLTESQLALIRDIRRRGKNKVAAQNCRKRKLDQIMNLAEEVKVIHTQKSDLVNEFEYLSSQRARVKQKFALLYRHIFQSLRDPDGNPYSPHEYSLQQSADGTVLLVPRSSITNHPHLGDPSTSKHREGKEESDH